MDAVVGVGVPLRKHHALSTTLGAATPVRVLWVLAIEALDQLLCNDGLVMLVRWKGNCQLAYLVIERH